MISNGDQNHTLEAISQALGANSTYVSQQNAWLATRPFATPRDYLAARVRPHKPLPEFTNYSDFVNYVLTLPNPT